MLSPRTWWRYISAARRSRHGRITAHPLQASGFAILDTDSVVRYLHRGRTLGDYPPIDEVRTAVASATAAETRRRSAHPIGDA